MKTKRDYMIEKLVDSVDNWELEDLIVIAKEYAKCDYEALSTEELEAEYYSLLGTEDYPETFPEGYNEQ